MNIFQRSLLAFSLVVLSSTLIGQTIDSALLESLKFRSIGPAGMSGRVTAIDVDPTRPYRIFVGAASGGVWKSEDGGLAWEPIFDVDNTQSVGALKINPSNPDEIWVGTGEGNPRNSHNSGEGVYKSIDGGKTWECMGLENTRVIQRIIIDPRNPNTVYVGALGPAWGAGEDRGVYKTTDGGKTWFKILYVNDRTGVADMVIDPLNHKKLIVAMWEYGRTPWDFTSGGKGSGLHITFDGGESWKQLSDEDGLPKGELGRIGIAIAHSKPNIVYAIIEAKENALYKSVNGGLNWSLVTKKDIGNRPFYYSEIYVDPSNENRIWNLWTYVSKSEDGGKTFKTILDYGKGVHPDHHAFWQSKKDPLYMIEGNDGGINISRDGGKNWRFITNLPLGQFYHVNIDMDYPYNVYGGMQDNGTWIGPGYVLKNGGIRNADWREIMFGDGFDIMPQQDNNRYGWAMSQGGSLGYYDKETGFTQTARPVHPDGTRLRFNWNAAMAQDPFHIESLYFGSQFVHKSNDSGKSWEIISPDLTTNDTTKQHQDKSGGLTIDATQAENHTTILVVAPSPVQEGAIWVGTDDGRLHISQDGGGEWTSVEDRLPGCPKGAWIPQIEVSQSNAGEAWVVVNNYRMNDWEPYLYHTTDFGTSFTRVVDGDDVHGFVCSVVQDPVEPNLLFLGTDDGLYFSISGGTEWQKWSKKSFPSVQVRDMKIHPREHDLVLATFGRAFWILDDIRPLRRLAATGGAILDSTFAMFDAPDGYMAAYRSVDGIRFTADAEFRGDNRGRGARFTYWKKKAKKKEKTAGSEDEEDEEKAGEEKAGEEKADGEKTGEEKAGDDKVVGEKDKAKKKKSDKVKFYVLDSSGDTIRTFTHKPKDGFNQISWNMRRDGVRYPSRSDPKDDSDLPSGRSVLPGAYKIIGAFGDAKDSTTIIVRMDPRIEISEQMLIDQDASIAAYEVLVTRAYDGFETLKNAKKTVSIVNAAIVNAPDSTQKMVKKQGKEVTKRIDKLMKMYMRPEDLKGIHGATPNLNQSIFRAKGYLSRTVGPAGQNGMNAVENAKRDLTKTIDAVNSFVDEDWKDYRLAMEEVEFNLFMDVEKVE